MFDFGEPGAAGEAGADSAIDAPPCSSGSFGARTNLPEFDMTTFYAPQLTDGGRELWVAQYGQAGMGDDLMVSRRTRLDVAFPTPEPVIPLESPMKETEPSLSADGLDLVFTSNRSGATRIWEARRGGLDAAWSEPLLAPELANLDIVDGVELSADGLTLYYNQPGGTGHLQALARPSRTAPFSGAADLGERLLSPSVSTDQLEMFGVVGNDIHVRRREEPSGAFGGDAIVDMGSNTPDISADGRTLIVKAGGGLAVLLRDCPR